MPNKNKKSGFTLVELSIVLVIIGLIVGGVLVGQDLIEAARVRSTISKIQQYQVAVNTFKVKYGYLPGDIPDIEAVRYGFTSGTICYNHDCGGNGDGIIYKDAIIFWRHLEEAKLIEGHYQLLDLATAPSPASNFFPKINLTDSTYIYTILNGPGFGVPSSPTGHAYPNVNFFSIDEMTNAYGAWGGGPSSHFGTNATLKPKQVYAVDVKIDDGLPQSGNVLAFYNLLGFDNVWAGTDFYGVGKYDNNNPTQATIQANQRSSLNCYDNNGVVGVQQYSTATNDGNNKTCAIAVKFQ